MINIIDFLLFFLTTAALQAQEYPIVILPKD